MGKLNIFNVFRSFYLKRLAITHFLSTFAAILKYSCKRELKFAPIVKDKIISRNDDDWLGD